MLESMIWATAALGGVMGASGSVAINFVSSLIVTTASDVIDGDTSSINALLANPGPDGFISLREAITGAAKQIRPGAHEDRLPHCRVGRSDDLPRVSPSTDHRSPDDRRAR